jgi:hypothetical protein
MKKFFRIQSTALQASQKTTKAMIVIEFEDIYFILIKYYYKKHYISDQSYSDKSLCDTRQKNYFVDEKFEFT